MKYYLTSFYSPHPKFLINKYQHKKCLKCFNRYNTMGGQTVLYTHFNMVFLISILSYHDAMCGDTCYNQNKGKSLHSHTNWKNSQPKRLQDFRCKSIIFIWRERMIHYDWSINVSNIYIYIKYQIYLMKIWLDVKGLY